MPTLAILLQEELKEDRILGAMLDEVLYADDTIIHSTNPQKLEKNSTQNRTRRTTIWTKIKPQKIRNNDNKRQNLRTLRYKIHRWQHASTTKRKQIPRMLPQPQN